MVRPPMHADASDQRPDSRVATDLHDFIVRIEGGLGCELGCRLVDIFGESGLFTTSKVSNGRVVATERSSEQLNIPRAAMHLGTAPARGAARMLANAMHDWMDAYMSRTNHAVQLDRFSAPNLHRYEQGSFFANHVDSVRGIERILSVVALLPSAFTGGEFCFFDDRPFALEPGDVVIFPASFMYPHAVRPVLSGVRYSVVSWMN